MQNLFLLYLYSVFNISLKLRYGNYHDTYRNDRFIHNKIMYWSHDIFIDMHSTLVHKTVCVCIFVWWKIFYSIIFYTGFRMVEKFMSTPSMLELGAEIHYPKYKFCPKVYKSMNMEKEQAVDDKQKYSDYDLECYIR